MFKSVRLKNFKGYKDSGDIPLAPLTVLIGCNNTGKSTVLQSLLVLKQTVEDPSGAALVTSGPYVDLGGFYDIIHGKTATPGDTFCISATVVATQSLIFERQDKKDSIEIPMQERLTVDFSLDPKSKEIMVDKCSLGTGSDTLINVHSGGKKWSSGMYPKGKSKWRPRLELNNFFPDFQIGPDNSTPQRMTKKLFRFINGVHFQSMAWSHFLRHHLNRVGPHRSHVPWYAGAGTRSSSELGHGGANLIAALGSTEAVGKTGKTLLDLVNEWACDRCLVLKRFRVGSVDVGGTVRMLLGDENGGLEGVNVAAMGEGVSQLLPIISNLVVEGAGDCLLIEQPEAHLHPSLQVKLAKLFVDVVLRGRRQVIVETHSEHILLGIRRLIAEDKIRHDQVSVLFVEKVGNESVTKRLDLTARGHFNDWPDGFFDEAYQEAMALAQAASRKPR